MKLLTPRSFVLMLVAFSVWASGLLAPEPAAADRRLFKVERAFFGAPFPPVRERTYTMGMWEPVLSMGQTIPLYGGAGRFENYLEPFTFTGPSASMLKPQLSTVLVTPSNKVGAPFTLPRSFIDYKTTRTYFSSTAFTGYSSISRISYVNNVGRFRGNNPYGVTMQTRVFFPTTGGNPAPNYGTGSPVTSTTTHGGNYDFSRAGSFDINPGPNRFGGTMRFLYNPTSEYLQYVQYFRPNYFRGYGTFGCTYMGADCSPAPAPSQDRFAGTILESRPGQLTSSGGVNLYLLSPTVFTNTATPTPFGRTQYRKVASPPAVSYGHYLHLIAPWTTGKVTANDPLSTYMIRPAIQGYDMTFASPGASLTVTRTYTTAQYNPGGMTVGYSYMTNKSYLQGVTRAVSMVRPRLIHAYRKDRFGGIAANFTAGRVWKMRVFFVPEPGALLMLGAGIAGLAGLYWVRKR
jgi:hypothetical protein